MRNLKITIQYDGTRYKGWQRLGNNTNTLQHKLEKTLSELLQEDIEFTASGRTDASVHAENQVANFHTNSDISLDKISEYCYRYLPLDIVVKKVEEVEEDFHSRFNVTQKTYTYKICNSKFHDVFSRKYSYHVEEKLDLEKMKDVASLFVGEHDFRSFTALKSKKKSTVREIYSIDFNTNGENIDIVFCGNGFLHKMVRILVGTLVQVGLGKMSKQEVSNIMNFQNRSFAPDTAPAHGLFLTDVKYK